VDDEGVEAGGLHDVGDLRGVAAEESVHAGLRRPVREEAVAVPVEERHVPVEGHPEPGDPWASRVWRWTSS
jgi:hypothetical protein